MQFNAKLYFLWFIVLFPFKPDETSVEVFLFLLCPFLTHSYAFLCVFSLSLRITKAFVPRRVFTVRISVERG